MNALTPGAGDSATWPACSGHPNDPRSPDESGFDLWEESVSYWEILDAGTIDSILYQLRHGSPTEARKAFTAALRVEYAKVEQADDAARQVAA
jgi:hypothetical protein